MKPRILVIGQLPPPVHGSNVMAERFMQALAANGYGCEIVEKTFSRSISEMEKISYRKVKMVPDLCRRVLSAVRGQRPDICVYFISVGLQSLLVDCLILWMLRKRNVPYVLYFHGKGYRTYESPHYFPLRPIVRTALKNAVGGLVLGERLKEDVSHCIPDHRLFVIPNGIPSLGAVQNVSPRKEGNGIVRVVFLSNLIPSKGPMRFLMMAKQVRPREPCVRFTLAGGHASEPYLHELKDFIAAKKLSDCVELPGPVYGREKEKLLREMDILVFPTSKETFGIVNLEAMQRGVPVVSSPVGAIPEVVRDGVSGYIVDPDDIEALADRVLRLVRDPELRLSMGNAGREIFEHNCSLDAYYRNTQRAVEFFMKRAVPEPPKRGCDSTSFFEEQ